MRLDANNQPVFISRAAGLDANCKVEDKRISNGKGTECDFFISPLGLRAGTQLSLNETRYEATKPGYARHSVLRDRDRVLGILDEHFKVDGQGMIAQFDMRVRPPKAPGAEK